jgi:hypothetical protein
MKLLEQTEIKLEWFDLNKLHPHPYPQHKRSKGLHLTDILRKIAIRNNMLTEEDRTDEAPLRVFLGMCWEAGCVRLYPDMKWQPGEVSRDGVAGSPDGESTLTLASGHDQAGGGDIYRELAVEEFKYTAKSIRKKGGKPDELKDIGGEWLWMMQVKGYLAMHPSRPTLARLHVCWARGNYQWPMEERYVRYLIRFTQEEIEGCWAMVKKNRYK